MQSRRLDEHLHRRCEPTARSGAGRGAGNTCFRSLNRVRRLPSRRERPPLTLCNSRSGGCLRGNAEAGSAQTSPRSPPASRMRWSPTLGEFKTFGPRAKRHGAHFTFVGSRFDPATIAPRSSAAIAHRPAPEAESTPCERVRATSRSSRSSGHACRDPPLDARPPDAVSPHHSAPVPRAPSGSAAPPALLARVAAHGRLQR